MRRKIAISGSHGSGKTTLAHRLKEALATTHTVRLVPEVAREMVIEMNDPKFLHRANTSFVRQLFAFSRQLEAEGRAEIGGPQYILCDRCLVDHWAYTEAQFPEECATQDGQLWSRLALNWMQTFEVLFLLPVEFGLVGDEIREKDREFQSIIDRQIRKAVKEMTLPVHILSGSTNERLIEALTILGA